MQDPSPNTTDVGPTEARSSLRDVDVERLRADTPSLGRLVHLDHAGSSPSPEPVVDAVVEHLRLEAEVGGYRAAAEQNERIERVYDSIARLVGSRTDEIAFAESATRAWDLAFGAIPLERGDTVLTARAEYVSNMLAMLRARDLVGIKVEVLPDDADGQVDLDALARRLARGGVALVALPHVPSQSGLVNPVAEAGALIRAAGVPYLLDACQSIGQLPVDVDEIGCDLICATGRKFLRAPRGTGFLYVRDSMLDRLRPPVLDTRSADWTGPEHYSMASGARRFELFERSYATFLGLGTAVDYALGIGLDAIAARNRSLASSMRSHLDAIDGVSVHDPGVERCAIVTFTVDGRSPEEVKAALWGDGIVTSVSPTELSRIDLAGRGLDAVVRASVHYVTTDDEVDRLVDAVSHLV